MKTTNHASTRQQQRGIPQLIVELVRTYGSRQYDHHGGVIRYLDKKSKKSVERVVGSQILRRLHEYLDVYVVESADGMNVITTGHRYQHINRV